MDIQSNTICLFYLDGRLLRPGYNKMSSIKIILLLLNGSIGIAFLNNTCFLDEVAIGFSICFCEYRFLISLGSSSNISMMSSFSLK